MNEHVLILLEALLGFGVIFYLLWRFAFKKLHKLILEVFFGPFLVTFGVVTFIFLVQYMLKYVDELSGKDLSISKFAELFFYFSFNMMQKSLPLAILLSSLMTYGNLGQHNELTAIKSSGISLPRILVPVLLFVCVLSFGLFHFTDKLLPGFNLKAYSLMYDIKKTKPALDIKEDIYYNEIPGYAIYVGDKHEDGETLSDVQIYDHKDGKGRTNLVLADSGRMYVSADKSYLFFDLYDGVRYSDRIEQAESSQNEENFIRTEFKESSLIFDVSSFSMSDTPEKLFKRDRRMLPVAGLQKAIDSLQEKENEQVLQFEDKGRSLYRYGILYDSVLTDVELMELELSSKDKKRVLVHAMNRSSNVRHQLEGKYRSINKYQKDSDFFSFYMWTKYADALACVLMFFLGAPVGAIVKKGGLGYPVLVTVIFFVFYYVTTEYGYTMMKAQKVSPEMGVWGPYAVMAPFAIFFMIQARMDSDLFDVGFYVDWFKKLLK